MRFPAQSEETPGERSGSVARSLVLTKPWLWTAAILVLLGMALRERAPTLLGLLTLVTAGGSWLWAHWSLRGVEITRRLDTDRAFPGETVGLHLMVVNRKPLPLAWLDIEDRMPDRLRLAERETIPSGTAGFDTLRVTTAVRWYERVTWRFHVSCGPRGFYTFGPITLRSGDLFGFFTRREHVEHYVSLAVYPQVVPLEQLGIPPRHLFGELAIRRLAITDPSRVAGVREYRPEDSFRFVHWKATARTLELQTKRFEPSTAVQFGVFLNLDTFEHYWEGIDYERAEVAISVAASIATSALEERHTVGVFANGVLGGSDQPLRVRPGRSPEQAHAILFGLARLSPLASVSFPRLLAGEAARFPMGSTIVVVTAVMPDALSAVLLDLDRSGHQLVLVSIGAVPAPPIRGLLAFPIEPASIAALLPTRRPARSPLSSA